MFKNAHITTYLSDLIIPEKLSKDFLICNDGDDDKILILSSCIALDLLMNYEEYFADGTFKVAPTPFCQLFSLHANLDPDGVNSYFVLLVYALLPSKNEEVYRRFFFILKERFSLNITKFKCDFEVACINALRAVFPDAPVTGCSTFKKPYRRNQRNAEHLLLRKTDITLNYVLGYHYYLNNSYQRPTWKYRNLPQTPKR